MKKFIATGICFCLFFSCEVVYFSNPQPVDAKDLKEIPDRFRGNWTGGEKEDFDRVFITDDRIVFDMVEKHHLSIREIEEDSDYRIQGDSVLMKEEDRFYAFPYTKENDSIRFVSIIPLPFVLSDSLLLRKVSRNICIFSAKSEDENIWEVYLMHQEKSKNLIIRTINMKEDLDLISRTIGAEADSVSEHKRVFRADMKKAQIRTIYRDGGFSDTLVFLPQRLKDR